MMRTVGRGEIDYESEEEKKRKRNSRRCSDTIRKRKEI